MNRHARMWRLLALCGVALLGTGSALGQEFDENGEPIAPTVISGPRPVTPQAGVAEQPEDRGDSVSFDAFSDPVELTTLVDYVGSTLGINIVVKGTLTGTVMFNAPVDVPKSNLLDLLDALLEQYDYTISQDISGIYTVQPKANVPVSFGGERPTSKIIDTAGLRPTGLQNAIQTVLGQQAAAPGQSPQNIAYIDELGVIVMTGTARNIARVEELIANLRDRYQESRFSRIELEHVAAPVARERLVQLVGSGTATGLGGQINPRNQGQQGQVPGQTSPGSTGSALDNIGDRLTVDAQSNALIFRGNDSELVQVLDVMRVIDVPNSMQHRQYFAGSAVQSIADLAQRRGLGEVITLQDTSSQNNQFNNVIRFQNQQQQGQLGQTNQQITGGPIMIVDVRRQSIIYYGTESQQEELAQWIELLDVGEDIITLEYYKLSNARAEDVATIIQGLITGQSQTGESPLLPGGGQQFFPQFQFQQQSTPQGEEAGFAPDPTRVFVIADEANNQVVVKAPKKQQDEFAKLVGRLDLRRPQVYLQVQIVAVSDSRDFRLAVESQLSAGQFQAQNLFGLSSAGTGGFQDPRTVSPNLPGFTSALIRSDMIPFIINAVRTDTDSRILSSPQLLVNDNEEASIAAIDQEPTTSTSQGDNTTITSFQGYEPAGTELTVTPTISEAGYIRLEYQVTLSSFTGQGADGIPPPKSENTVTGIATIPSDASIVVGGIEVDNTLSTVVRVPLLGDIPIVGHLFRDTNKGRTKSLLYIFITPRILTDPNFQDLRLLTKGPQGKADIDPLTPPLSPSRIETVSSPRRGPTEDAKPEESEPIIDGDS